MRRRALRSLIAGIALVAAAPTLQTSTPRYTRSEHAVAMRDGKTLFTIVFARNGPGRHAILLNRTPYGCGPFGDDQTPKLPELGEEVAAQGWTIVCQEVRGSARSQGVWDDMRPLGHLPDEATDAWDTIDWLIKNVPANSGRVVLWGISYPGFYAAAVLEHPHPALACVSPQAPQTDWWLQDVRENGAFHLRTMFGYLNTLGSGSGGPARTQPGFGFAIPDDDAYSFFLHDVGGLQALTDRFFGERSPLWRAVRGHPDRDAFWRERALLPHVAATGPRALVVGGWYDEQTITGPIDLFHRLGGGRRAGVQLVMGPWEHYTWSAPNLGERHYDIFWGAPTAADYRRDMLAPFLIDCLEAGGSPTAAVRSFDTGRARWTAFDRWPPQNARKLKLALDTDNRLRIGVRAARPGSEHFVSDPANPVPHVEEHTATRGQWWTSADQRFASRRPDVLTYASPPLAEAIELTGPIVADLWVTTDHSDADWIVKLIDVQPQDAPDWPGMTPDHHRAGYQRMVRAGVMRGRYRDDPARPKPFTPGLPTRVRFALPDVHHSFLPGHRIMVQIQSSWFPLIDRNPQSWQANIYRARSTDYEAANHAILSGGRHRSMLTVTVLGE